MLNNHHLHDDSDCETNTFVKQEVVPRKANRGHEFDPDVKNDDQFIAKIFSTESLNHTTNSVVEFYSDIYYILNDNQVSDKKTVSQIFAKKKKPSSGCFSGSGKAYQRITQEDVYLLKLKAMLKLAHIQEFSSKYDINNLRLFLEIVLEESIPALHMSIFYKQKKLKKYVGELKKLIVGDAFIDAMWLAARLFKKASKYQNMEEEENRYNAAKRINGVFIPYIKLIESDKTFLNKHRKDDLGHVYEKIKNILAKPEVKALSKEFPVHLVTTEISGKIKSFMESAVDPNMRMVQALATTNPAGTQNIEINSPMNVHGTYAVDGPLIILEEASPNADSPPAAQDDIKVVLSDVAELKNEEGPDQSAYEGRASAKLKLQAQPPMLENLSELEASKKHDHDSMIMDHFYGPTPRLERLTQKSIENNSCELSHFSEEQLKAAREESSSEPATGTFSQLAKKATLPTRSRGVSNFKPIHKLSEVEDPTRSPMKKFTKIFSINTNTGGQSTRRFTTKGSGGRKPTNFEPNELTDESPVKSVISKNQRFNSFEPDQAEQEEAPAAVPKVDEAFHRVIEIGNDYTSKWERVSSNPLINIDKIMPEGSPVVLIRAWAFIEGFSPKEVFDQIFDTEKRAKWETVTMGLSVVEKYNENSQVMYFYIKTPIGITERDFVQKRNYLIDYPNKGEITMTFKSVVHEKAPVMKGRIRAETHISGYIMRPSTRAPNSTDFCIISQSDIKGAIPKFIVNTVSSKAPAEWIRKLIQACERSRKEGK